MDFVNRFLSFEKLMGGVLVRIIYFIGLAFIALASLASLFQALQAMGYNFMTGLGMFLLTPIFALISVLFWRFVCEIYIVLFRITEQLNEIKLGLKPPAED